jgi:single-stranded DNA-binding protein
VLSIVTKGREIAISGRLAINEYLKEEDGNAVKVSKPVIRLSSFYLCGKKPQ